MYPLLCSMRLPTARWPSIQASCTSVSRGVAQSPRRDSTSIRNLLLGFATCVLHCAACDASWTPHPRRPVSGERSPYHPHPERTEDHVSHSSGHANRQEGHDAHQRALALVRLRSLASFLHPSARCGGALRPSRCSARPSAARQPRVDASPRTAYNQENRDPWPPMARRSRRRSGAARR